jgi:hypothetical protein
VGVRPRSSANYRKEAMVRTPTSKSDSWTCRACDFSTHETNHGGEFCAAETVNVVTVPSIAIVVGDRGPIAECVLVTVRFCIVTISGADAASVTPSVLRCSGANSSNWRHDAVPLAALVSILSDVL